MWNCYYCRVPISLDVQKKNRLCPNCGSDIHACQNCTHYDPALTSKCKEPDSPWVADRSATNQCPFFEFTRSAATGSRGAESHDSVTEAEKAKKAFRDLFR